MKYLLLTIAFALLLSTHQSAAFNGSGLGQELDKVQSAQVNNKTQVGDAATDAAKKEAEAKKKVPIKAARKRVETTKKAQQTPVQSSGGVNEVQLMKPDANADRNRGVAQGSQSQQQPQQEQQNVDSSQESGDTLSGNNDSYVSQTKGYDTDSDSKQDDKKVEFFSGGKMKWGLFVLAVVVVLFFALHKKPTSRQPKLETGDGSSVEEKKIATLYESLLNLKAEVEVLKQQNIKLKKDFEESRKQTAANSNSTTTNVHASTNSSSASTKPSSTALYANILNGMVFQSDDMQSACDEYTVFVLNVSGNEGTFKVNDAPNAQLYLISNFAYTVASAVEVRLKSANAKTIATVQLGRVHKTESGWTIVKKAVVELR